jgi:hypothetical protein
MKTEPLIDWLRKNKNRLSLRAIEKELGMPPTILTKAVNGHQKLSAKWISPLTALKNQMCGGEK